MKKFLKGITFFLILIFLWSFVFKIYNGGGVLWLDKNPIYYYFKAPKNTFDITYIGSSNVYAHFNTLLAFNEYGFTTGLLSTDCQSFLFIKYLLKESIKYQKSNLYIIDLAKSIDDINSYNDGDIRKTADFMPSTINRIEAIKKILNYRNVSQDEYLSHYISFLLYHNRWKNITQKNFENIDLYKGHLLNSETIEKVLIEDYEWINEKKELSYVNDTILNDLLDYLKIEKLNVLFVIPKRYFTDDEIRMLNTVVSKIEKENFKVLNFNKLNDFIIESNDFYNNHHLNAYGATKYTLYLSKCLKENYNLKDHREETKYDSWSIEYEKYKKKFYELTHEDYENMLILYKKKGEKTNEGISME